MWRQSDPDIMSKNRTYNAAGVTESCVRPEYVFQFWLEQEAPIARLPLQMDPAQLDVVRMKPA